VPAIPMTRFFSSVHRNSLSGQPDDYTTITLITTFSAEGKKSKSSWNLAF
jgi:hypothetical protein